MGPGTILLGHGPWTLAGRVESPIVGAMIPWRVQASCGSHCGVWLCSCPMSTAHPASRGWCFPLQGGHPGGRVLSSPLLRGCPVPTWSLPSQRASSWGESASLGPAGSWTLSCGPGGHTWAPDSDKVQPAGPSPGVCDCPSPEEWLSGEAATPRGLSGVGGSPEAAEVGRGRRLGTR